MVNGKYLPVERWLSAKVALHHVRSSVGNQEYYEQTHRTPRIERSRCRQPLDEFVPAYELIDMKGQLHHSVV